mmetsp:Transcript_21216/g.35575  ORF Transcript_21216/g.35575 Transcript_21216/m.35575 type:complete len:189 (-) Transcript_21216:187-753(-)
MGMFSETLLMLLLLLLLTAAEGDRNAKKKDSAQYEYYKRIGTEYLNDMAQKEGIVRLKSGMLVEILQSGSNLNAKSPMLRDKISFSYKFVADKPDPRYSGTITRAVDLCIVGWIEAFQMMIEGDRWRLYIPYELAYKEYGSPPIIKPYSTVVFELEIHEVLATGKLASEARSMFAAAKAPIRTSSQEL